MSHVTIDDIFQAGVVGAGGAGFPTYIKLSGRADTVLINAAECEPLLHKDKEILRAFDDEVLAGLRIAMDLVGASRGVIGIKGKYTDVIEQLRPKLSSNMDLVLLPDAYPSGDEFILVYEALGRVIPPGGIPLHVGAVVMNVETARNAVLAARQPVTEKFLTVAGAVQEPVTICVPIGVTLADCVALAGGPTVADPQYMVGGVMMGYLEENHQALVDKTTGGIIVLPKDHVVVRRRRQDWKQIARIGRAACDQCSYCTELCPRWLLGHPIEPHRAMRSLGFNLAGEANVQGTAFCCECNLCSLYSCPEDLDPKNVCVHNKRRILAEKRRWENPPFIPERADRFLKNRRAPTKRLMTKLGLTSYPNVGPLLERTIVPNVVGIKLKQHVGAPCQPVVNVGQTVVRGQVVGVPPEIEGKRSLGAPVHASIDGVVTRIEDGIVWIQRQSS